MPGIPPLSSAQLDDIVRELAVFRPAVVYLFGSFGSGTPHPGSDIDLAFLPAEPMEPWACFVLANELASRLGREVDLVDLTRASTVLAKEVLRTGVLLAESRPRERREFEMRALGDDARLNEERRCVLEAII